MKTALTLIQLFNLCDWVIALFIAGTVSRVRGRDGRRTFLAVGLSMFFLLFAVIRLGEFVNLIMYQGSLKACLGLIPDEFNRNAALLAGCKTGTFLFTWFAVTVEKSERRGVLSGNVIRNFLVRQFEKLR